MALVHQGPRLSFDPDALTDGFPQALLVQQRVIRVTCHRLAFGVWSSQRYFGNFGNLYNTAAIMGNPLVAKHGTTFLHGLDRGVKNTDNMKETYAELSGLHSEKLHVDPDNFKLISDCLAVYH
ncbi:hypothetical protein VZT92_004875 [Zoarces viviparus]|uniref:Globin domain-containing protein n=1 Tax=Zoarces viviparus TaxID=48416 RepID=A0AAW1FSP5_ZOAVI